MVNEITSNHAPTWEDPAVEGSKRGLGGQGLGPTRRDEILDQMQRLLEYADEIQLISATLKVEKRGKL